MAVKFINSIVFNTGRRYSAGGQEIIAFQAVKENDDEDCCIMFHDRARNIWGEMPPSVELKKDDIMAKYDDGYYVAISPFDSKAAELSIFHGREFRVLTTEFEMFLIGIFKDGSFQGFLPTVPLGQQPQDDHGIKVYFKNREAAEERLGDAGWYTEDNGSTWINEHTAGACKIVPYKVTLNN